MTTPSASPPGGGPAGHSKSFRSDDAHSSLESGRFCLPIRQVEALRNAAAGMTSRDAARAMGISPCTVRSHLAKARDALGAKNTTHAVALAIARGILAIQDIQSQDGGSNVNC